MSSGDALVRIPVGVVVERRAAASAWVDYIWRPVMVLPGAPDTPPWTPLDVEDNRMTFYAGAADLEFFRSETGNYRDNLNSDAPALWIALRPTGGDPPYELAMITADPAEGEARTETGSELVEMVPMPDWVQAELAEFVATHHVERVFFKRQRDRANPEALARRGPVRGDDK